jgi:hypothetical protein
VRGRPIQLFIKIAVFAALIWVARRGLIRWVNGPEAVPSSEPWPPLPTPTEVLRTPNCDPSLGAAASALNAPAVPAAPLSPVASVTPSEEAPQENPWLPPEVSGDCPPSHPVKAKRSTRLYREPGTAAYDRAKPDRCYVTPQAAEADGFMRAKR